MVISCNHTTTVVSHGYNYGCHGYNYGCHGYNGNHDNIKCSVKEAATYKNDVYVTYLRSCGL